MYSQEQGHYHCQQYSLPALCINESPTRSDALSLSIYLLCVWQFFFHPHAVFISLVYNPGLLVLYSIFLALYEAVWDFTMANLRGDIM